MPNEKRFEVLNVHEMKLEHHSMMEVTETFSNHIKHALRIIADDNIASFEVPNDSAIYRIVKTEDGFDMRINSGEIQRLEPIEVLNLLFEKAPFISFVGTERGDF